MAPTLSSVFPSSIHAGSPGLDLTVQGMNFSPGLTVRCNGQERPTASTGIGGSRASILSSDLAAPGTAQVTVAIPAGLVSNSVSVTIIPATDPVPSIVWTDKAVQATSALGLIRIVGSNLTPYSRVRRNGSDRLTLFHSSDWADVVTQPTETATPGNIVVTVFNPAPGGGESNPVTVEVVYFVSLLVQEVSPRAAPLRGLPFTLTVPGRNLAGLSAAPTSSGPEPGASPGKVYAFSPTVFWTDRELTNIAADSKQITAMVPAGLHDPGNRDHKSHGLRSFLELGRAAGLGRKSAPADHTVVARQCAPGGPTA